MNVLTIILKSYINSLNKKCLVVQKKTRETFSRVLQRFPYQQQYSCTEVLIKTLLESVSQGNSLKQPETKEIQACVIKILQGTP